MLYIYGIIPGTFEAEHGGVGGDSSRVFTIREDALGAIVSEIDHLSSLSLIRDSVLHEKILEQAMTDRPVLPVSFATTASSSDSVKRLLRDHAQEFHEDIKRIDGTVEVGIKVFWRREAVLNDLAPQWGKLDNLKMANPLGDESGDPAAQFGKAVYELLEHWKSAYLKHITRALEASVIGSRYNPPIGIRMLLNAAYLVKKEHGVARLRQALSEVDKTYGDRLQFHFVAPLPPYNFVDLRITGEEVS